MALKSIPARQIVQVVPSAISTGGNQYTLNGVFITSNSLFPTKEYFDAASVGVDFGTSSDAYNFAVIYFQGTTISTSKPKSLFITRYNQADISAKLIGATLKSKSITDLQTIKGTLSVTVDGTAKSGNVDLSTATSWSNAAQLISTDLSVNCTFNSQTQAFVVASATTGTASSIGYATGTASDALGLSLNGGGTLDNETVADTATSAITRLRGYTLNYGGFTYDSTFTTDQIKAIATWASQQTHDVWNVAHLLEPTALIPNNAQSFGAWVSANNISDTTSIYGDITEAALALGYMASLDFSRTDGRMTMDFRNVSGLPSRVDDPDDAKALETNGYTYYGGFATKANRFIFFRNSRVSGDFGWVDSYLCQLRLNGQLQNAILSGLVADGQVPYTEVGLNRIRSYCQDPINEMVNFGGIQAGVTLSSEQKAKVNSIAGYDVSTLLFTQGWVLIIDQATPDIRAQRGSPTCTLIYTDGQSVQTINLASMAVL